MKLAHSALCFELVICGSVVMSSFPEIEHHTASLNVTSLQIHGNGASSVQGLELMRKICSVRCAGFGW
jgi:hypothetical protein